jgi:hypothetical protein
MEEEQPDLFDMKFVRDELFYYSRDENQFLRRRRIIAFVFDTTLTETRFKDAELPVQRIVMVLSLVLTLVRKMTDWLSSDALRFELIFLQTPEQTTTPLKQEMELLQLLLREPLERGSASVRLLPSADAAERFLDIESRTSQVHVLDMGLAKPRMSAESLAVTTLKIPGSRPELWDNAAGETDFAGEDAFDDWVAVAHRLLELWV